MLIVLPNAKNGLPALLKRLTSNAGKFASVLNADNFHTTDVELQLPVFSTLAKLSALEVSLSNTAGKPFFEFGRTISISWLRKEVRLK